MDIENQVCSLELAKKLLTLGVKQNSLFYWDWHSDTCYAVKFVPYSCPGIERYSAFTVAELGEMLSFGIISVKRTLEFFYCGEGLDVEDVGFDERTEADARAKMLIYLIENNLMEIYQ